MTKLHYNYNYLVKKRNGYRASQVFNSTLPSTYTENYSFPRQQSLFRRAVIALCLIAVALFLALDVGAFDGIYIWLSR